MVKGNKGKIDNLGRVVIPKSIRKALDINHNDDISMFVENNQLIITKGHNNCDICGNKNVSVQIKDKFLCSKCLKTIKSL
tara:strand:- start:308 stop:547 length:240 start_codon:yes stop_codon:yes gene_type:complete